MVAHLRICCNDDASLDTARSTRTEWFRSQDEPACTAPRPTLAHVPLDDEGDDGPPARHVGRARIVHLANDRDQTVPDAEPLSLSSTMITRSCESPTFSTECALTVFEHTEGAEQAYSRAPRQVGGVTWAQEIAFVEHHRWDRIVFRGGFAGHYVDADDEKDFIGRTTFEGALAGVRPGCCSDRPASP
jgi:hypothetical protein